MSASPPTDRITAQEIFQALTEELSGEKVFYLSDLKIAGKLDLRYLAIKKAIEIIDCEFEDDVDFRFCEFLQPVNLSGCTFKKSFNCGDEFESFTVFHKDLLCSKAIFNNEATFTGMKCKGSGDFEACLFLNENALVNFDSASFASFLDFGKAIFKAKASFNQIQCGKLANFAEVKFENKDADIDFVGADWGNYLIFDGAELNGGGVFNSNKCQMNSTFNHTKFLNPDKEIDFSYFSCGLGIECNEAVFDGGATFNSIQCMGSAYLKKARFNNPDKIINFRYAYFGKGLECEGLIIKGGADFRRLKCEGKAIFKGASFPNVDKTMDFGQASITGFFTLEDAVFNGSANFHRLNCQGKADFTAVRFENRMKNIDLKFAAFQRGLDLSNAVFACSVDLNSVTIDEDFIFNRTQFRELNLANACLNKLVIEPAYEFQDETLILAECTFASFSGNENSLERFKQAKQFANAQLVNRFSRDPYIQLEKYFTNIGEENLAKDIYYEGRLRLRQNARNPQGNAKWSKSKWISDSLLKNLSGYGVKNYRLFFLILFFIALGIYIFWADEALRYKPIQDKRAAIILETSDAPEKRDSKLKILNQQEQEKRPGSFAGKAFQRFVYSCDLFVPVIKFEMADKWEPVPNVPLIYSYIHKLAGWILVPLLVASISGVVKKQ